MVSADFKSVVGQVCLAWVGSIPTHLRQYFQAATMIETTFYLHEDDWGLVCILPKENFNFVKEESKNIQEFSQKHFDGISWTDCYVIQEEKHSISERKIKSDEINEKFSKILPKADLVQTGYSSYREECKNCFAFGYPYKIAIYGGHSNQIVTSLNLSCHSYHLETNYSHLLEPFVEALAFMGEKYDLLLVDWNEPLFIDLKHKTQLKRYFLQEEPYG